MTKRLYDKAGVIETPGGFGLALDGKPVTTPAGADFNLASRSLADAIADEWNAQTDTIDPHTMPLMQLASTAIDRVANVREDVIDAVAGYGETDLLCHRDEAGSDLAARQVESWQPHLDWLSDSFNVTLAVGEGIMPVRQDKAALKALRDHVADCGDLMVLAGLAELTALLGSVVLALAVFHGRLSPSDAHALAHLDETFQEERWGGDEEARDARARRGADVAAATRFLALLRG